MTTVVVLFLISGSRTWSSDTPLFSAAMLSSCIISKQRIAYVCLKGGILDTPAALFTFRCCVRHGVSVELKSGVNLERPLVDVRSRGLLPWT